AALQTNGKIVVAGYIVNGSDDDFLVERHNADGSLDSTFGIGGIITTDFAGSYDQATAVALQSDGKIVVAGEAYTGASYDFALARYTTTGVLDTTFGPGLTGMVTTDFAGKSDD